MATERSTCRTVAESAAVTAGTLSTRRRIQVSVPSKPRLRSSVLTKQIVSAARSTEGLRTASCPCLLALGEPISSALTCGGDGPEAISRHSRNCFTVAWTSASSCSRAASYLCSRSRMISAVLRPAVTSSQILVLTGFRVMYFPLYLSSRTAIFALLAQITCGRAWYRSFVGPDCRGTMTSGADGMKGSVIGELERLVILSQFINCFLFHARQQTRIQQDFLTLECRVR